MRTYARHEQDKSFPYSAFFAFGEFAYHDILN